MYKRQALASAQARRTALASDSSALAPLPALLESELLSNDESLAVDRDDVLREVRLLFCSAVGTTGWW